VTLKRETAGASLIDMLDRVLDKGIVMEDWVRASVVAIDLLSTDKRVVVAGPRYPSEAPAAETPSEGRSQSPRDR
jgi:hypothetical protein